MIFEGAARPPKSRRPVGFFVYEFWIDGRPRYVGKGTDDRPWDHFDFARVHLRTRGTPGKRRSRRFVVALATALEKGRHIQVKIAADKLTEAEAYALEIKLIAYYGDQNLYNQAEGGVGLSSPAAKVINSCPRKRAAAGAKIAALCADPDFAARRNASFKAYWSDPNVRAAKAEQMRASWTPERKAAQAERKRQWWASATDEQKRKQGRVLQKNITPEVREKICAGLRAYHRTKRVPRGDQGELF